MKVFKTLLAVCLGFGLSAQASLAQETKRNSYPYVFVGLQGGAQTTFTNYKANKLITPIGAVSVGGQFTPAVGARLHVSGLNEKGGLKSIGKTYDYKFVTSNLDLMLNLCNVFAPGKDHLLNAYLIGGAGLGYAWDNDDLNGLVTAAPGEDLNMRWSDDRLVHNFRVGMQLAADFSKRFGVNLEVTANNYHDRFNSKLNGKGDWQLQALIGVTYKIPCRKKKSVETAVALPPQDFDDSQFADNANAEPTPAPVPEPKPEPRVLAETKVNVHFTINSYAVSDSEDAKLRDFAQWMKSHPTAQAQLTGYADAGTGTAEINRRIAQKRAERVAKMLTEKYGVDAARLTVDSKGDTIQPFAENDANRVVIGVAKEK